ncbi:MAG: PAS domain-containing protein, partial [Clostridiales bacterium]|nr:PAS domain-containing protein [Clostridiales bacterium]
ILNGSNGRILYSNKHFNSMINKSTKDIVNKKISNLIDFENEEFFSFIISCFCSS